MTICKMFCKVHYTPITPVFFESSRTYFVKSLSGFRMHAQISAPLLAKTSIIDLPIPRLHPVTTAVLPSNNNLYILIKLRKFRITWNELMKIL